MPRSPSGGTGSSFNSYTGQLAVSVQQDGNSQWTEGKEMDFQNVILEDCHLIRLLF